MCFHWVEFIQQTNEIEEWENKPTCDRVIKDYYGANILRK